MKIKPIVEVKHKEIEVVFTAKTWNDIQNIVKICDKEVSWFSEVTKREDAKTISYYISKVYIPEQHVHATTTEMSPAGQAAIMTDVEDPNMLRCLGHSHVDMPTFMSGQDNTQFKNLYKNVDDHYISAIFNKKGEVKAWLCDHKLGYIYDEVEVFIGEQPGNKTRSEWAKIIKEKVLPLVSKVTRRDYHKGGYGKSYGNQYPYSLSAYAEEETTGPEECSYCTNIGSEAEMHHVGVEESICQECYEEFKQEETEIMKEINESNEIEEFIVAQTCDLCGVIENDIVEVDDTGFYDWLCPRCITELAESQQQKKARGNKTTGIGGSIGRL